MKKYKSPALQRNPSIIRLDFLSMTGAKDLDDLKKNYSYYYQKMEEEINCVGGFNKNAEKKELVPVHRINFANLVDEVYFCKKCKKELIYVIHKKKLYYQDTPHQYNKGIAKVVCLCGEINIFNFNEKDKVSDKNSGE